jgi:hypothetical protein
MRIISANSDSMKLLAALISYGEDDATFTDVIAAARQMLPSAQDRAPNEVLVVVNELMHAFNFQSDDEGMQKLMDMKLVEIRKYVMTVNLGDDSAPVVANFTGPRAEA